MKWSILTSTDNRGGSPTADLQVIHGPCVFAPERWHFSVRAHRGCSRLRKSRAGVRRRSRVVSADPPLVARFTTTTPPGAAAAAAVKRRLKEHALKVRSREQPREDVGEPTRL